MHDSVYIILAIVIGVSALWIYEESVKYRLSEWALDNGYSELTNWRRLPSWHCLSKGCIFCMSVTAINAADGRRYRLCLSIGRTVLSPVRCISAVELNDNE